MLLLYPCLYEKLLYTKKDGVYPDSFSKADKGSLRKRAKFFTVKDAELYYQSRSKAGKTPHDYCFQAQNHTA